MWQKMKRFMSYSWIDINTVTTIAQVSVFANIILQNAYANCIVVMWWSMPNEMFSKYCFTLSSLQLIWPYHTIPYSFTNVADIRNLQQYCYQIPDTEQMKQITSLCLKPTTGDSMAATEYFLRLVTADRTYGSLWRLTAAAWDFKTYRLKHNCTMLS